MTPSQRFNGRPSLNLKTVFLTLGLALILPAWVWAEENKVDDSEYAKAKRIDKENALYMDLAREIELEARDRSKRESGADNEQVKLLQSELDGKLKELEVIRKEVSKEVKAKAEANENLKLLVSLYETISAEQTAELLKRMPASVSLAVMQMMSPKKASKILSAMDPKVAAELSRRLITTPALATNNGGSNP